MRVRRMTRLLKTYQKCIHDQTTNVAWQECGDTLIKAREQELDATLKRLEPLLKSQSTTAYADLLKQQQAWKSYEGVACNIWLSDVFGREGTVLNFAPCKAGVVFRADGAAGGYRAEPGG